MNLDLVRERLEQYQTTIYFVALVLGFTLAMLVQSDAIAPLAAAVADSFAIGPTVPFVRLPLDIDLRVEPYGLIRRRGSHLTPAALRLAEAMLSPPPAV